jgi:TPR repeat protein
VLEAEGGPNPNEALRFLRVAAELGVTRAFARIGRMCEVGVGTDRDAQLAQAAYARAAAGAADFEGIGRYTLPTGLDQTSSG